MNLAPVLYITITLTASIVFAGEHHKRAPSGFTGVRGKKSIPDSAYNTIIDDSESPEILQKPEDYSAAVSDADSGVVDKRAPSGFMGMRGKKPFTYMQPWEGSYADALYKRAPSGFMGMRGKKDNEFVDFVTRFAKLSKLKYTTISPEAYLNVPETPRILDDDVETVIVTHDDEDEVIKIEEEENLVRSTVICWADQKRAPSGFMGMRGKKENRLPEHKLNNYYSDKRAPMGFLGMRGKKNFGDSLYDNKQTPFGFVGMRGKKHPSGFFGMRGKKHPYEFRGKFVGVRGKKMSNKIAGPDYTSDFNLDRLGQQLDINQLMLLLTESEADVSEWNENDDLTRQ